MEVFAGAVGPGKGESQQAHHLGQASSVSEVGVFEVEAPRFRATEQGFDLPAVGVGFQGLRLGCPRAGDEQERTVRSAHRRQVDEAPQTGRRPGSAWLSPGLSEPNSTSRRIIRFQALGTRVSRSSRPRS